MEKKARSQSPGAFGQSVLGLSMLRLKARLLLAVAEGKPCSAGCCPLQAPLAEVVSKSAARPCPGEHSRGFLRKTCTGGTACFLALSCFPFSSCKWELFIYILLFAYLLLSASLGAGGCAGTFV